MENEEVLNKIFDALGKSWEWLCGVVKFCVAKLLAEDVSYDGKLIVLLLFLLTIMLASAFWAACIAKARRHAPLPHFLLGFCTFFLYPIFILFAMDLKGMKRITPQKEEENSELLEAKKREEEAAKAAAEAATATGQWNEAYFNKIARKADGSPAGPWKVSFLGTIITVRQILEVLPDTVVTEIEAEGGETRKLRIRFDKIDSWE